MSIDIQKLINNGDPIPVGTYTLDEPLNVPAGMGLLGSTRNFSAVGYQEGPAVRLEFTCSAGKPDDPPLIHCANAGRIHNVTIGLPAGADYHTEYPWTILLEGPDCHVEHVYLDKVWQGIYVNTRGTVRDVYCQPLLTGIQIDNTFDQTFLENINCDIFDPSPAGIDAFMFANATCFAFLKSDLFRGVNLLASSTKVGYLFDQSSFGLGYGHLTNFSVDTCTVGVQLNAIAFPGASLSGFDIIGCPKAVVTGPSFGTGRGKALFANGCFSGGASGDAMIAHADGQLTITGCAFDAYNGFGIAASGGSLNLTGCQFTGSTEGKHVALGAGMLGAVVANNMDADGQKFQVKNALGPKAMIANNYP